MHRSVVIALAINYYNHEDIDPEYLLELAWWLCWQRPDIRHLL